MKVLLWTTLCLALSAFVIGKAIAALRRGEPYRFGFLDGGLVGQGKEADPRIVIGGALAYLKHDAMGPAGDAAVMLFNPGDAHTYYLLPAAS